jgi:uncharacterized protein (DUF1810 family)
MEIDRSSENEKVLPVGTHFEHDSQKKMGCDADDAAPSSSTAAPTPPNEGETTTTTGDGSSSAVGVVLDSENESSLMIDVSGKSTRRTEDGNGDDRQQRQQQECNDDQQQDDDDDDDPYHLEERFIRTQRIMFSTALAEIQRVGKKRSCWLWFVLPTAPYVVNGVERGSRMNRRYALRSDEECAAYLARESRDGSVRLRKNYVDMLRAIREQLARGNTMRNLFGSVDDVKAVSSFRLFERIGNLIKDEELAGACKDVLELAGETNTVRRREADFTTPGPCE